MSVKATNWAWELGHAGAVKGGELLTLLRVADHADNDGVCWPGEKSLAEYTAQGDRTVRRHLADLAAAGYLHRERVFRDEGRGRSYDGIFLHLDQPAKLAGRKIDVQPATDDTSTGQIEHVQPATDDTALYREPTTEPSGTKQQTVDPVDDIFEFWKRATNRNGSTHLTPNRRTAIKARLDEGRDVGLIKQAIANVATSPFHQGKNEQKRRYDDITLICRNGEKLEQFAELGGGSVSSVQKAARRADTPVVETDRSKEAWESAKKALAASLPGSTFDMWVAPFEVAGEREGHLVLVDSSEQGGLIGSGWADRRWRKLFIDALGGAFDDVELVDEKQLELEAA